MITESEVDTREISDKASELFVVLSGSVVSVAAELRKIARKIAGEFGPPKDVQNAVRVLRVQSYRMDGRVVSLRLNGVAHRGKLADDLEHYAGELLLSLEDYENKERVALS